MIIKIKKNLLFLCGFFLTLLISNASYSKTLTKGVNNVSILSGDKLQGYQDIISNKKPKKITIDGKLYLPDNCENEKLPAVIIQHGSGDPKMNFYADTAKA